MSFSEKIPTLLRLGRSLRQNATRTGRWLRQRIPMAISSTRCFLRRSVRPAFFTLVCLITVIALFVAEENYRTGKEWEKYQTEARARGEKLTLAELAPPPVPDDQNFAMTPLIKSIFSNPKARDAGSLPSLYDLKNNDDYPQGDLGFWPIAQKADLTLWGAYLQPSDLLTAFKKLEPKMAEISVAIQRPYSRFPVQYDKDPPALIFLPHIEAMISLSKLFELRAEAELNAGQADRALDDAITDFRLARAMDNELALLISAFTEQAQRGISLQIVWEGLAANRWSDGQIAALQKEMQSMDLFPEFVQSFKGERAFFLGNMESTKAQSTLERWRFWKNAMDSMGSSGSRSFGALLAVLPSFAMNRAQTEVMDYYNQYIFASINIAQRRIDPKVLIAADDFFDHEIKNRSAWLHPQVVFEWAFIPTIGGVLRTYAKGETDLDEAILACALERFKIERGDYPTKLDELVPQFIEKLPHDVINGDALHYQRTPDGRFMLYSVGWDMQDDHGVSVDYSKSDERGDWVWQYSPAHVWGH